jgi:hypothetical protein
MAGWLNEEEAAVNSGILDVAVTLGSKFLAEVCGVLVLDVFHNWVPAREQLARS